ncbi:hypothetical protein [Paraburkholderia phenoliruptrix]|uniref:hypothetical protein n=1 Tax=Paraburkholderia phenoliruptrix TaxID=252970 RepID=UPI001C6E9AF4|nr:hypothetical protein [Paraburkholderia phenoliruptrix]MBW9106670.1 hypothetical protein [Paraburkholderia phenoliruptrix]MBW9133126.1 hypothetical protein [Paraburkholderia ginsengiterrae]
MNERSMRNGYGTANADCMRTANANCKCELQMQTAKHAPRKKKQQNTDCKEANCKNTNRKRGTAKKEPQNRHGKAIPPRRARQMKAGNQEPPNQL